MPTSVLSNLGSLVRNKSFLGPLLRDSGGIFGGLHLVGIYIDGVEVTQAIQYRKAADHLTDPADRGPDNSIRLVADKPAYVRVYVRTLRASPVAGVTATVTVQKRHYGIWTDAGTLTQQFPATITAMPSPPYAGERGSLFSSLNFMIPAALMRGRLRLKVQVKGPGRAGYVDDSEVDVDASLFQTLRVRGIPVRYQGPDAAGNQVDLAPPTLADAQTTTSWTLQMWPVSQTPDVTLAGMFTQNAPLNGAIVGGKCPTAWLDLLFWLGIARVVDGNAADRLYYALLPTGIPIGGAAGCGGGQSQVGAGRSGDVTTMAHELGHVVGFTHAPCGLVTNDPNDPSYPAYEPYDTVNSRSASIGEYGLDATTATIYSPSFSKDFMSYCTPRWISPYHYQRLLENARLDPRWVSDPRSSSPYDGPVEVGPRDLPNPPPGWVGRRVNELAEPDPVPLIVLTGLFEGERIDMRSVLRLETGPSVSGERVEGTMAELLDGDGDVLARAPLRQMPTHAGAGCGGCAGGGPGGEDRTGLVQALLADPGRGVTLRVVRGDQELWSRRAPSDPPAVRDVYVETDADELGVRWSTSASDDHRTERIVRWSADDGNTWQTLAIGLHVDQAVVPLAVMTSGTALVQVLVSDGFHTVVAEPVRVEVPTRAPQVAILSPKEGMTVRADSIVRLWGVATASDGRRLADGALRWELDGETVGTGKEVWAELPDFEGEHECRLLAMDGDLNAEASVVFVATGSGLPPRRVSLG